MADAEIKGFISFGRQVVFVIAITPEEWAELDRPMSGHLFVDKSTVVING